MFSTHYHELTDLEDEIPGIKNYNIACKKRGDDIIFLRRIVPGPADGSYGIEVAKLAGVPNPVVKRAREVLEEIVELQLGATREATAIAKTLESVDDYYGGADDIQMSFAGATSNAIVEELKTLDVNTLTPIEAMQKLYDLAKRAKE